MVPSDARSAGRNQPATIDSNDQSVDLRNPALRRQLALDATQVNEVSITAGNENELCGGAAAASALVLASKAPAIGPRSMRDPASNSQRE